MSTVATTPPAPLLPDPELGLFAASLVDEVTGAAGASAGRDTLQVTQAILSALESVANDLDRPETYAAATDIPAYVRAGVVELAVVYLHRIRTATGPAAYDDPDPMGLNAERVILNTIRLGNKARWGLA